MMLELLMTRQNELDQRGHRECAGPRFPRPRRAAHLPRPAGRRRGDAGAPRARPALPRSRPDLHRHVRDDGERGTEGRRARKPWAPSRPVCSGHRFGAMRSSTRASSARPRRRSSSANLAGELASAVDDRLAAKSLMTMRSSAPACRLDRAGDRACGRAAADAAQARSPSPRQLSGWPSRLGRDEERCRTQLQAMLTLMSTPAQERGGSGDRAFLAFKLHRFISGAGHVYATLRGRAVGA